MSIWINIVFSKIRKDLKYVKKKPFFVLLSRLNRLCYYSQVENDFNT